MRESVLHPAFALAALLAVAPTAWARQGPPPPPTFPDPTLPPPAGAEQKAPAPAAPAFAPFRVSRQVARGVELIQEVTPASDPAGGPLVVTVLRVDSRGKGVRLESALGYGRVWEDNPSQGREKVSDFARRTGAAAVVNTSFFTFSSGHPIGLFVTAGDLVTEPAQRRTVFGITKAGKPVIAAYDYRGAVEGEGRTALPLNGLNRLPGKGNELLLFTPVFREAGTLPDRPGRVEVVLTGTGGKVVPGREIKGRVERVVENGGAPLAPGTMVLSGGGASADWLRANAAPGKELRVRIEAPATEPGMVAASELAEAAAGGGRLLAGGKVALTGREEGFGASFTDARHPRTAVGVTRDGAVLLLTVDGRQPGLSRGATLAETAALLLKFGAVDGVNMDGGGSTTMAVHGAVVNAPSSDFLERAVSSALLVYADPLAQQAPAVTVGASPSPSGAPSLLPGGLLPNGPVIAPPGAVWSATGRVGFVAQDGRFFARRPGTGELRLVSPGGKVTATVPVRVAAPTPAAPAPPGGAPGGTSR